jgi:hypothetical protein
VVFALARFEIQPETGTGIAVATAAGVGLDFLEEGVRCPDQLVGIEGGQGKGQATDAAVVAWIVGGGAHLLDRHLTVNQINGVVDTLVGALVAANAIDLWITAGPSSRLSSRCLALFQRVFVPVARPASSATSY